MSSQDNTLQPKTYEEIIATLNSNHIYPDTQTKNGQITELQVSCPLILFGDKKKRLEEILVDQKIKITTMPNDGYLLIKKIK